MSWALSRPGIIDGIASRRLGFLFCVYVSAGHCPFHREIAVDPDPGLENPFDVFGNFICSSMPLIPSMSWGGDRGICKPRKSPDVHPLTMSQVQHSIMDDP
jgi:hypothetical protein